MAEGAAPTSHPSGQEEKSLTHHEAMEITKRSLADIISVSIPSQNIAHFETYEPCYKKICFWGFQLGPTQTGLYSHGRWLHACNF